MIVYACRCDCVRCMRPFQTARMEKRSCITDLICRQSNRIAMNCGWEWFYIWMAYLTHTAYWTCVNYLTCWLQMAHRMRAESVHIHLQIQCPNDRRGKKWKIYRAQGKKKTFWGDYRECVAFSGFLVLLLVLSFMERTSGIVWNKPEKYLSKK